VDPAVLRSAKIFSTLSDEHLNTISAHVREVSVPEGTHVVSQGDFSTELMTIIEGEAEVLRDGRPIGNLKAGDTFGEIGVIDRVQRTATVIASTPMRLATLTSWDVKRIGLEAWFEMTDQMDSRELSSAPE